MLLQCGTASRQMLDHLLQECHLRQDALRAGRAARAKGLRVAKGKCKQRARPLSWRRPMSPRLVRRAARRYGVTPAARRACEWQDGTPLWGRVPVGILIRVLTSPFTKKIFAQNAKPTNGLRPEKRRRMSMQLEKQPKLGPWTLRSLLVGRLVWRSVRTNLRTVAQMARPGSIRSSEPSPEPLFRAETRQPRPLRDHWATSTFEHFRRVPHTP